MPEEALPVVKNALPGMKAQFGSIGPNELALLAELVDLGGGAFRGLGRHQNAPKTAVIFCFRVSALKGLTM